MHHVLNFKKFYKNFRTPLRIIRLTFAYVGTTCQLLLQQRKNHRFSTQLLKMIHMNIITNHSHSNSHIWYSWSMWWFIYMAQITKQHKWNKKKNNSIKNQELIACWWAYKNTKIFRFSKLMCSNIFEPQRVGERPSGLIAQPALFRAQINLGLKTFHM